MQKTEGIIYRFIKYYDVIEGVPSNKTKDPTFFYFGVSVVIRVNEVILQIFKDSKKMRIDLTPPPPAGPLVYKAVNSLVNWRACSLDSNKPSMCNLMS